MRKTNAHIILAVTPAVVWGLGCAPTWRPGMERVRQLESPRIVDLREYRSTRFPERRTFIRRDLRNPDEDLPRYEQVIGQDRQVEGSLLHREMTRLSEYLLPGRAGRTRPGMPWPAELADGGAAFFLELDSPLPRIPATLCTSQPVQMATGLQYYDCHGLRPRGGTLGREVTFEGFETVDAGGETYPDCVRLRIYSRIRIKWGPWVDVTEYVWLAQGVGEVRRIEHVRGLAWLIFFGEAYSYERTGSSEPSPSLVSQRRGDPAEWSCIAVHLDRCLPHPRLGGLAVDVVRPSTVAGTTAPEAPAGVPRPRRTIRR